MGIDRIVLIYFGGDLKTMDAFPWAKDVRERPKAEFGKCLRFVGLQGSRVRGETRANSDIDLVALLMRWS